MIFPDQHLSQDQHLEFARHFGPLETTIAVYRKDAPLRVRQEFADVSNLNHDNEVWGKESRQRLFQLGNRLWHTDSSFKRLPARASLLYARSIPTIGGHTEFADERAAYDALPEATKRRLASLVAEHSIFNSRARLGFTNFGDEEQREMPPVPQVMVARSQIRPQIALPRVTCGSGLRHAQHDGCALIDELVAHATQRQFVYTHRWRVHDLVIWDNRCTMHRGTDFDDLRWKRDMQRATVCDIANSCEQEGIDIEAAQQASGRAAPLPVGCACRTPLARGRAPCSHLRDRQSQVLAQCRAGERLAEQAAALQLGDDEAHEGFIGARDMGGGEDKAVAGRRGEPLLELVGHLLRAADDGVVHAPASADLDEVAHCGIFLAEALTTRSRMPCRPDISSSSSAVNASSMPFFAKSKLSASDNSDSASISSGSFSISAHLSSASAFVAAATVLMSCEQYGTRNQ